MKYKLISLILLILIVVIPLQVILPQKSIQTLSIEQIIQFSELSGYLNNNDEYNTHNNIEIGSKLQFLGINSNIQTYDLEQFPDPETKISHRFNELDQDLYNWNGVTQVIIDEGFGNHPLFEDTGFTENSITTMMNINASAPESDRIDEVFTLNRLWELSHGDLATHRAHGVSTLSAFAQFSPKAKTIVIQVPYKDDASFFDHEAKANNLPSVKLALDWIYANADSENIDVVSMSIGYTDDYDTYFGQLPKIDENNPAPLEDIVIEVKPLYDQDLVDKISNLAQTKDIMFTFAAGNHADSGHTCGQMKYPDGTTIPNDYKFDKIYNNEVLFPANLASSIPNVISVGSNYASSADAIAFSQDPLATARDPSVVSEHEFIVNNRAIFSAYDEFNEGSMSIMANGVYYNCPTYDLAATTDTSQLENYPVTDYVCGTSISTPTIATAISWIKAAHPNWSSEQVRNALFCSASDTAFSQGSVYHPEFGYGILDTYSAVIDPDKDGLVYSIELEINDYYENILNIPERIDPFKTDTDDDGFSDLAEYNYWVEEHGVNGPYIDYDQDGLPNLIDPDSDNDGLLDGDEKYWWWTDLESADSDNDGFNDLDEMYYWTVTRSIDYCMLRHLDFDNDGIRNLDDPDVDGDGLLDGEEVLYYNTDPYCIDSDYDLWPDGIEIDYWENYQYLYPITWPNIDSDGDGYLNWLDSDSDNDGRNDYEEIQDSLDPGSWDTDRDGMWDNWEFAYNFDPRVFDSNGDRDGDGLIELYEFTHHTNPSLADTDGDGLLDGEEVNTWGTDPRNIDHDGDGLLDGYEVNTLGSDPTINNNPMIISTYTYIFQDDHDPNNIQAGYVLRLQINLQGLYNVVVEYRVNGGNWVLNSYSTHNFDVGLHNLYDDFYYGQDGDFIEVSIQVFFVDETSLDTSTVMSVTLVVS